ncbi:MAG: hypothetical protein IJE07_02935 [Clostridia bacterium]|nr:hypothetical protein [Clostridia bacterium]
MNLHFSFGDYLLFASGPIFFLVFISCLIGWKRLLKIVKVILYVGVVLLGIAGPILLIKALNLKDNSYLQAGCILFALIWVAMCFAIFMGFLDAKEKHIQKWILPAVKRGALPFTLFCVYVAVLGAMVTRFLLSDPNIAGFSLEDLVITIIGYAIIAGALALYINCLKAVLETTFVEAAKFSFSIVTVIPVALIMHAVEFIGDVAPTPGQLLDGLGEMVKKSDYAGETYEVKSDLEGRYIDTIYGRRYLDDTHPGTYRDREGHEYDTLGHRKDEL